MTDDEAQDAYRRIAGALAGAGFSWLVAELEEPVVQAGSVEGPPAGWRGRLIELLETTGEVLTRSAELAQVLRQGIDAGRDASLGVEHGRFEAPMSWRVGDEQLTLGQMWLPADSLGQLLDRIATVRAEV